MDALPRLEGKQAMITDFDLWFKQGIDKGWISTVFCQKHDGTIYTDEEMELWETKDNICIYSCRIYRPKASDV
jgi:hypothetical protein